MACLNAAEVVTKTAVTPGLVESSATTQDDETMHGAVTQNNDEKKMSESGKKRKSPSLIREESVKAAKTDASPNKVALKTRGNISGGNYDTSRRYGGGMTLLKKASEQLGQLSDFSYLAVFPEAMMKQLSSTVDACGSRDNSVIEIPMEWCITYILLEIVLSNKTTGSHVIRGGKYPVGAGPKGSSETITITFFQDPTRKRTRAMRFEKPELIRMVDEKVVNVLRKFVAKHLQDTVIEHSYNCDNCDNKTVDKNTVDKKRVPPPPLVPGVLANELVREFLNASQRKDVKAMKAIVAMMKLFENKTS